MKAADRRLQPGIQFHAVAHNYFFTGGGGGGCFHWRGGGSPLRRGTGIGCCLLGMDMSKLLSFLFVWQRIGFC